MASPNDPYATKENPVTAALVAFSTLTIDQKVLALAAALIEAKVITSEQLRGAVLRLRAI